MSDLDGPLEAKIRAEVRVEEEAKLRTEMEPARIADRDRAMRALVLSVGCAVCVMLPLVAVVSGGSVRLFLWASGLR